MQLELVVASTAFFRIMDKYAEGEAKGIQQGIEQIAINMLKDNEPLDKISRFTGLSQDDIVKLRNKL